MKGYLLDTNLLIALLWPSHEHHKLAVEWFTRHRGKGWATCPMTEAGFVRIVSNPAFSRAGAVAFAGVRLMGHQQVTDAYLLGLASSRGGVLATLDKRIAALIEPKSAARTAMAYIWAGARTSGS